MKNKIKLSDHIIAVADFPKPGILFRDISPLLKRHFFQTMDELSALLSEAEWLDIDLIAGIESRGFIFASALAYKHQKGFLKVRKAGKLPNVHASIDYGLEYGNDSLEMQQGDGSRVLLVDDLIASGGSMTAAADLCIKVGYQVMAFACLVDLKSLNDFNWHGKSIRSVIQYSD